MKYMLKYMKKKFKVKSCKNEEDLSPHNFHVLGDGSTREAGLAKLASIDEILEYEQELALEEAIVNFRVL